MRLAGSAAAVPTFSAQEITLLVVVLLVVGDVSASCFSRAVISCAGLAARSSTRQVRAAVAAGVQAGGQAAAASRHHRDSRARKARRHAGAHLCPSVGETAACRHPGVRSQHCPAPAARGLGRKTPPPQYSVYSVTVQSVTVHSVTASTLKTRDHNNV